MLWGTYNTFTGALHEPCLLIYAQMLHICWGLMCMSTRGYTGIEAMHRYQRTSLTFHLLLLSILSFTYLSFPSPLVTM